MTTSEFSYNLAGSVRHQGLPVAGVAVFACAQSKTDNISRCVAWQKTGSKGEFSLAVKAGIYNLEVRSSGNRFLNQSISEVSVSANTTCNISLSTGYILSGKVVATTGDPILQGAIVAQEIDHSAYVSVANLEKGKFSLVLPRGEYRMAYRSLSIDDIAQLNTSNDDWPKSACLVTDLTVVPIRQDSTVEIVLPQLVSLTGNLLDHVGKPVSDACVTVKPSELLENNIFNELGVASRCKSDEEGHFQLFIQPGVYDFTISPPQFRSLFTLEETRVSIYENCSRQFQLQEGCQIAGKVLYEGEPVADCLITIFDALDQPSLKLQTNTDGHFQTTLPKGRYKILASVSGLEDGLTLPAPTIEEILVADKMSFNMELKEGVKISGKVVDESLRIRTGVSVFALLNRPATQFGTEIGKKPGLNLDRTVTDRDGRYSFHLAAGNYSIVVNNDFNNAKFADVELEPLQLDFSLPGWRQLSLEIVGEDGRRVSNCQLGYAPYTVSSKFPEMHKYENIFNSEPVRGSKSAGSDNIIQIVLPSGVYTLEITPPGNSYYEGKLIRQLSLNNDILRKVVLPLKNHSTRSAKELRLA